MSADLADALRSMQRLARVVKVNDSGPQQIVDVHGAFGDKPRKIWRVQDFGYSSNPPAGSEGLLQALAGNSDRLIYRDGGHQEHRPKNLPAGGTALYDADGKLLKIVKEETTFDAGNKPLTLFNATKVKIEASETVAIGVGGTWITIKGGKVYLGVGGPDETVTTAVVTTGGPSTIVFAKV